jgi:hypothetical protein
LDGPVWADETRSPALTWAIAGATNVIMVNTAQVVIAGRLDLRNNIDGCPPCSLNGRPIGRCGKILG